MPTLTNLLGQREELRTNERALTEKVITEVESYVLSSIHLACKIKDVAEISQPEIVAVVRRLYDDRLDSFDIIPAIKKLTKDGKLKEHKLLEPNPSRYSLADLKFDDIPLIGYWTGEKGDESLTF
ncbi:MAG: hypothetical protein AABX17_00350 [Nanoarchaeota archaeon]